ncbi:MAG: phytanoyl-CoA dioxygenase family protein, partial [Planctomycetaceae bacterium]
MASVSQASSVGSQVRSHGFAVVDSVLDAGTVAYFGRLVDDARSKSRSAEAVTNSSGTYGLRNLTDVIPEVADLVRHPQVCRLVTDIAGDGAFMVRATLFDKTPGANWGVFWHQDLSIAVASRHDVAGFTSWTRKAGVDCTQPPVAIMEQLLAVRLHLDDCTARNGALRVLPGTHLLQRLSQGQSDAEQAARTEIVCEVPAGGAVLMRPLLLHASSPMEVPASRRVIHFEFAA